MYARVCVDVAPAHLDRPFDYLVPEGVAAGIGSRVRVVFNGRRRLGWVVGLRSDTDADQARIRSLVAVEGDRAWFDEADLRLYRWVADRYAGTLADVLRHALPPRVAAVEREQGEQPPFRAITPLQDRDRPNGGSEWAGYEAGGLLRAATGSGGGAFWLRPLTGDEPGVLVADLVARCLAEGRSALVLAPDPASPVPGAALRAAGAAGVDLRGLADDQRRRYRAFLAGRDGGARVVVGERSAVFAPLRDLGLVVVDDEANPAYKERRSPRYHARDVALARGRMAGASGVLIGDLPSAQLWRLLQQGHVTEVAVDRAAERAHAPRVDVVDLSDPRPGTRRARFSDRAAGALSAAVRAGGAAVVLAARGGQGGGLACKRCRTRRTCPVCSGSLTPHGADTTSPGWACRACGWEGAAFACTACQATETAPLHAGAGRLAQELARSHPGAEVARMEGFDAPGPRARPALGVMTRGSVVARPSWLGGDPARVVVLPDADALLGRASVAASEDALRLWFAAARWTPHVVLQTREPLHPAVQALVRWDPHGFWEREAERRAELRYPPHAAMVALTAAKDDAVAVAAELRAALPAGDEVLGPDLDGGLLVKSDHLRGTLGALTPLRHAWSKARRRVRVDVDPLLA